MLLFEVNWPGTEPIGQDGQPLVEQRRVLHLIERAYKDATLAVNLFRSSMSMIHEEGRNSHINDVPINYFAQLPAMYARAFVYASDTFLKCVEVMSGMTDTPANVAGIATDFRQDFPNLIAIRDSAHHMEDRIRSRVRNKPLDIQPVLNSIFNHPDGALIIDFVRGENYGTTVANGHYVEIEVSEGSMNKFKVLYENLLNAFTWA